MSTDATVATNTLRPSTRSNSYWRRHFDRAPVTLCSKLLHFRGAVWLSSFVATRGMRRASSSYSTPKLSWREASRTYTAAPPASSRSSSIGAPGNAFCARENRVIVTPLFTDDRE